MLLEQADRKLEIYRPLESIATPPEGWIHTVRTALNMTLLQLGRRVGSTAQNVKALEKNEKNGTITLRSLREIGKALDLKLVYGFVPKDGSLEKMIEKRAMELARDIVNRSAQTMELEAQGTTKGNLMNAIQEKKRELETEIPKFLWH